MTGRQKRGTVEIGAAAAVTQFGKRGMAGPQRLNDLGNALYMWTVLLLTYLHEVCTD